MGSKYVMTEETIEVEGHVLHRIRAKKDFGDVKAGDFGGYIENESNLSHNGNCWVYDNAMVYENAYICGKSAKICDHAKVYGNAYISYMSIVSDYGSIYGNVKVCNRGTVKVHGNAKIYGGVLIDSSDVTLYDNTELFGAVMIKCSNVSMYNNAKMYNIVDESCNSIIIKDDCYVLMCDNANMHGEISLNLYTRHGWDQRFITISDNIDISNRKDLNRYNCYGRRRIMEMEEKIKNERY